MIKIKIPQLMKEKGITATDLMRHGGISYVTAHRLSKGEGSAMSFEVLENLCRLFRVDVGDILEFTEVDE